MGRARLIEEEEIRRNGGIRGEAALGKPDDGMETAFTHEVFLDSELGIVIAEEESVRQDDDRAASLFQPFYFQRHEKVSRLGASHIRGEGQLVALRSDAAVGRIHGFIVYEVICHVFAEILFI